MKTIYFDNNATTQVDPAVLEAMLPFLTEMYGNPSSMHTFGGKVGRHVTEARAQVAAAIGAAPEEIIFTSCGSESDNTAIRSALQAQPDRRHIITTRVEHPAVLSLAQHLEKNGVEVSLLGVDAKGRMDLDELRAAIRKDTAIISIMTANNETGTIFPIAEAGAIAREHGVPFHTDAVQAVGKVALDMKTMPVDYLALSGHKLHAPKGVGALYVRRGTAYRPFLRGGHQERGRRAGTENVASIVALGKACELATAAMHEENTQVRALRDRLESGLLAAIPDAVVNGDTANRLPNTSNIAFKYVEGEAILLMLDQHGVCASSGSACTSGSLEPSHVLRAMGVPFTFAHGSIRFSLSRFNTMEDVEYVVRELPPIIRRLREISPFRGEMTGKPACTC
ncbi:cysteine desulfurase NifS [Nitratidesulfovibrio vulgaris]|jgi:cysteine desulfurase|uniref:Cysteine desulfurase n=1 Tax=Nitratidesulfovibrio vulgaris (strain DP4) TaxID=391774 RepID=A0A0H3AAE3_NITV4|nr:cysteine desulfurase NifS [Nitratidesulfovibrio vulgaris]ABM29312.1 aminotransferase, class V [Nitratidesulfovibrio vulgaris DP4]GEB79955.1 cysteine desulfurase NifS [Desulfovibrio desulfuricans]HBW15330.1 cysteine desulfurase NifS [Desulfovibrio sp.]